MSNCKEHIYKLEGAERFRMSSINLTLRNFEHDSKFQICESDSHIQLKTPNIPIMEVFR